MSLNSLKEDDTSLTRYLQAIEWLYHGGQAPEHLQGGPPPLALAPTGPVGLSRLVARRDPELAGRFDDTLAQAREALETPGGQGDNPLWHRLRVLGAIDEVALLFVQEILPLAMSLATASTNVVPFPSAPVTNTPLKKGTLS